MVEWNLTSFCLYNSNSVIVICVIFLIIVSVPVQLFLIRHKFERKRLTEIIYLVTACLEFAIRHFLKTRWSDIIFNTITVLIGMRVFQLYLSQFLSHLFQNFWLCLQILDHYLHDLLHALIFISK